MRDSSEKPTVSLKDGFYDAVICERGLVADSPTPQKRGEVMTNPLFCGGMP
jgi:hypothetical protein